MKLDEFGFANQQLAGMLKSGIPLEGALQQLCATMQRGELREELQKLRADLAQGTPLRQAIGARKLPEFYVRMIQIGAQGNDLPAMLTLLADYYQQKNNLWVRLQGLMVYPLIVLLASLALGIFFSVSVGDFIKNMVATFGVMGMTPGWASPTRLNILIFAPVVVLTLATGLFLLALFVPGLRNRLQWRVVAFREANLSYFASSLQLLLKQGTSLRDAIQLLRELEGKSPLGEELGRWEETLASGKIKSIDLAARSTVIPPLFFWFIAGDEENWVAGLGRAAETFYASASRKAAILLYAVLPVSVLFVGMMVIAEIAPMLGTMVRMFNMFGGD